jgi:HlyD family secretion protein
MTTKKLLRLGIPLVLLSAAGYGVFHYVRTREAAPPRYQTVTADRGRIAQKVTATGTLSALVTVQVGSQVSGRIESIYVDYNSQVKKGQLIAKIDPLLFQAAAAQARANLASARANLTKAKAQAAEADRQLARTKSLAEQKLGAAADLDTATSNSEVAHATVAAAQAGIEQASAAVHQAEVNLKFATITSPIDGVVISKNIDVGQTVAASLQAPTLFTIAQDLTKMQVDTNVAEGDVGKIRPGMPVTFTVDAFTGRPFQGVTRQVRDAAQTIQNVVTYDAVIDVDNSERLLKPGMTATVTFVSQEKNDVLRVANAAFRYRPAETSPRGSSEGARAGAPPSNRGESKKSDKRTVYLLRDGKTIPVDIIVGLSDGSMTEVTGGELHEGDTVVTEVLSSESSTPSAPAAGGMPRRAM